MQIKEGDRVRVKSTGRTGVVDNVFPSIMPQFNAHARVVYDNCQGRLSGLEDYFYLTNLEPMGSLTPFQAEVRAYCDTELRRG